MAAALGDIADAGPITHEPCRHDNERVAVQLAQWRAAKRSEDTEFARSVAHRRAIETAQPQPIR